MKKKTVTIVLSVLLAICVCIAFCACGELNRGDGASADINGTYYRYVNGIWDKNDYIKISGEKWTSESEDINGTIKTNGSSITLYMDFFGDSTEYTSGSIGNGVLKLRGVGQWEFYCLEGKVPPNSDLDRPIVGSTVTVTFNANGGVFDDGKNTLAQNVDANILLTAPLSPSRKNYYFSGWATGADGSKLWNFATDIVTKDITLYAVWQQPSAVILSVDGASIDDTEMKVSLLVEREIDSVSLSNKVVCSSDSTWKLYYDRLGQTEIPTKIAASRTGELANGDNVFYIVVTSATGTQVNTYTLTVHRSYAVNVNYYDNKNNLINQVEVYTGHEYSVNYTPTIAGYSFNYWKNIYGNETRKITPYGKVDLYADCTVRKYNVLLDTNGGSEVNKSEYEVAYDKAYSFNVPARTGYTFSGWYDGNTRLTDSSGRSINDWTFTSNKTLKAQWQANSYHVTLNINDSAGGVVSGDGDHDYDSSVTVTAETNSGYTWLGWYDGNDMLVTTDLSYSFTMGFSSSYTAKWMKCPITVKADRSSFEIKGLPSCTVAGEEYTLEAIEKLGYSFLGWYNGETLISGDLSCKIIMPSTSISKTYTAKFDIDERMANFEFVSTSDTCIIQGIKDKSVTEITIPDYVSQIEGGVFYGCSHLESITLPFVGGSIKTSQDTYQYPFGYIFGTRSYTGGTAVKQYYHGSSIYSTTNDTYYIPSSLKSVTIKGGNMLHGAFDGCSGLTSVTIPNAVTSIGDSAFWGCSGLTSVTIPNGVTSIGDYAFYKCSGLTSITIGNGVTSIGDSAFGSCIGLASITIPDNVTSIGQNAFYGCSGLTSVTIPNGVTSIDKGAFWNCFGLKTVTLPNSITSIGENAFAFCNITDITIPNGVTSIGKNAFVNCKGLTSIEFPNSVTSIGEYAFHGCIKLTSIIIPDSVTSIGTAAFSNCSSLQYNEFDNAYYLGNIDNPYLVLVKVKSKDISSCSVNNNTKIICSEAFYGCSGLTSITIPDSVTSIGDKAFWDCSSLTIYCEAAEKPSGWHSDWNYSGRPVVWNHKEIET